jgi:hypothetical protein
MPESWTGSGQKVFGAFTLMVLIVLVLRFDLPVFVGQQLPAQQKTWSNGSSKPGHS